LSFDPRLLWLRYGAQVGFRRLVAGENLVGFFVGNRAGDDYVVALMPIGRSWSAMFCGQLDRSFSP
jgi:hypothetical protein